MRTTIATPQLNPARWSPTRLPVVMPYGPRTRIRVSNNNPREYSSPSIFEFVSFLYRISFAVGAKTIKMKGCFTDMHECNQTECVARVPPRQGGIHFCCCKGSLCNEEQQWILTTTEATTQGANGL